MKNQWKIMDFHAFPRFLGKSGKLSHHPPKFCASLHWSSASISQSRLALAPEDVEMHAEGAPAFEAIERCFYLRQSESLSIIELRFFISCSIILLLSLVSHLTATS